MKKTSAVILSLLLFLGVVLSVNAQNSPRAADPAIPEKNGDYPDPEHPGVRVHVFVHEPKARTSTSELVCSDPDSNAVVPSAGWRLPAGKWTYNLNISSVPLSVGSPNLSTIASNGFSAWSAAVSTSSSKPNFVLGPTTTVSRAAYDGQHVITWGRTQGTALAVTYVWYYTNTGIVVDVDTIMNLKFQWAWNGGSATACGDPNFYDAQDILTHEQGHWMGSNDTYNVAYTNNTMFGYGSRGETKKNTLTTGDIQGVQAIYP